MHVADNVGLVQRCDAIDRIYVGGDVIRLHLPEGLDREGKAQWVSARLTDPVQPEVRVLMRLNPDTLLATLDAVIALRDDLGYDLQVSTIEATHEMGSIGRDNLDRHLPFLINDLAAAHGYLIASALQFVHQPHLPSAAISQATIILRRPFTYDTTREGVRSPDVLRQSLEGAERTYDLADED